MRIAGLQECIYTSKVVYEITCPVCCFLPQSDIMDLCHQSSAMCVIMLRGIHKLSALEPTSDNFFTPVNHCSFFEICFYRSTGIVTGMSRLLVCFHYQISWIFVINQVPCVSSYWERRHTLVDATTAGNIPATTPERQGRFVISYLGDKNFSPFRRQ